MRRSVKFALQYVFLAMAFLLFHACANDFEGRESINGPRLLALVADAPSIVPGEQTTFSVLLTHSAREYQWSWCPRLGSGREGFPCHVDHERLQAFVDLEFGPGQHVIPPFSLGSGESANFTHSVAPVVWQRMCQQLELDDLPSGSEIPACDDKFEIFIRLDVVMEDSSLSAIRPLQLLYPLDAEQNTNPEVGSLIAEDDNGERQEIDNISTVTLQRGQAYKLHIQLSADSAQSYLDEDEGETRETLRISWFHEGGQIEHSATSFTSELLLEDAVKNSWTVPSSSDWPNTTARLFVVVRDNRGGTSWASGTVRLQP